MYAAMGIPYGNFPHRDAPNNVVIRDDVLQIGFVTEAEYNQNIQRLMQEAFRGADADARQAARDDDLKTKVSVTSPWAKAAGSAIGNQIDATIYAALGGAANSTTTEGGATVALPAAQKLATEKGALQLRTLQTIRDIAQDPSEKIVIFMPTEMSEIAEKIIKKK